jgi:hypothetical protein
MMDAEMMADIRRVLAESSVPARLTPNQELADHFRDHVTECAYAWGALSEAVRSGAWTQDQLQAIEAGLTQGLARRL